MESGVFFSLAPPQLGQKDWRIVPFLPFFGVDSTLTRFRDFLHFTCATSAGIPGLNPIGRPKTTDQSVIG